MIRSVIRGKDIGGLMAELFPNQILCVLQVSGVYPQWR